MHGRKGIYRILVRISRHRWEGNIKMNFKEI